MNVDLSGTGVKASSVDPGYVETEFSVVRFHGDAERADAVYEGFEPLTPDDVADTVWYVASRPARVNVFDVILVPTAQRDAFVVDRDDPGAAT
jgi:NADP-dependent 3-hydroxy acid dehydrogenase YdfG